MRIYCIFSSGKRVKREKRIHTRTCEHCAQLNRLIVSVMCYDFVFLSFFSFIKTAFAQSTCDLDSFRFPLSWYLLSCKSFHFNSSSFMEYTITITITDTLHGHVVSCTRPHGKLNSTIHCIALHDIHVYMLWLLICR